MSGKRSNNRAIDSQEVMIRWARPDDLPALQYVAALDSRALPAGPLLVAVVDGEIWAAMATIDGQMVADPFRRTLDLVGLLRTRASQLGDSQPRVPVLRLEPLLARLR
jgi:hypothetical protein